MGGKTDAVGPGECGKRGLSFADEDLAGIKQCMPNVCETSAAGAAVPPLLFQLSRNRKTSDSPREILRPRRIAFRIHVEIGNVAGKKGSEKEGELSIDGRIDSIFCLPMPVIKIAIGRNGNGGKRDRYRAGEGRAR